MKTESTKSNWPLVGNGHIFEFLAKSLASDNVAGSYIFTGPGNIGKTTAANYFARSLVCQSADRSVLPCGKCASCLAAGKGVHGDIYIVKKEPDKKNISIDQIREFIRSLSMSSFLNSYKIGVIKGAENLSQGAVNALLKTLEEPKPKVVIILTVVDLEALPATIISRSQILRFQPVKSADIHDDLIKNHQAQRSQAKNFSRLSAGRPALALKFLQDKEYYDNYRLLVQSFFGLLSSDINSRFSAIEEMLGKNSGGQDAIKLTLGALQVWQNLARDLMLLDLDLTDLVQHEVFAEELSAAKGKLNLPAGPAGLKMLLNLMNILKQSREYLAANVNPRLALENAAVSF